MDAVFTLEAKIHGFSCNIHTKDYAETDTVSIFCAILAAVVATTLNRSTGWAHPVGTGLTRAVETH